MELLKLDFVAEQVWLAMSTQYGIILFITILSWQENKKQEKEEIEDSRWRVPHVKLG